VANEKERLAHRDSKPKEGGYVKLVRKRRLAWLGILLAFGLVAAACGDDDDDTASGDEDGSSTDEATDGGEVSGEIQISGSSTVEPITAIVGEEFDSQNDTSTFVDGPGTGDGFALFCDGETDISDASRPIEDDEVATCEENGIEFIELQIAFDGMAVMTNANNPSTPECLSFADLYALIGPEAEGISTWADAQPVASELGSTTELPDAELALTGPGQESGTYDSFIEIALEGIAEERGQEPTTRTDYEANADDNIIIQNIESSDTSLGWVGFAFAEGAGDTVAEIPISEEPGGDCVEPTAETISDESYPLSRPLFIYVNAASAEENPAVAAFVDFYLADLNTFVEEAGYIVMPDETVAETMSAWEGR
jgi:phosphate transport system substrate-binding protein